VQIGIPCTVGLATGIREEASRRGGKDPSASTVDSSVLVGSSMSWKIAGTNITGQGDPRWCGKRQRRRSNERDVGGDNQS